MKVAWLEMLGVGTVMICKFEAGGSPFDFAQGKQTRPYDGWRDCCWRGRDGQVISAAPSAAAQE
jgi:hypothetical protein